MNGNFSMKTEKLPLKIIPDWSFIFVISSRTFLHIIALNGISNEMNPATHRLNDYINQMRDHVEQHKLKLSWVWYAIKKNKK